MPAPYNRPSASSKASFSSALAALKAALASFEAAVLQRSAYVMRDSSCVSMKFIACGPIVTPISSIILIEGLKPSLKMHAAVSVAISNIFFPVKTCLVTYKEK
jgi:hypothetical protein